MTLCHYNECTEEGILNLKIGNQVNSYCKEHYKVMKKLKNTTYKQVKK